MPTSMGSSRVGERAVREQRVGPDAHAVRDLFGGREVGDERGRDAEAVGDDAGDVDGGVAHALDGREHVQHARHLLGVARRAGGEHAHLAHRVGEVGQALLELVRPRRPCRESPKNRAAYARSTMSSEVSFASESMALRLRGWSSCPIRCESRITAWTGAIGRSPCEESRHDRTDAPRLHRRPRHRRRPARPRRHRRPRGQRHVRAAHALRRAPRRRGLPGHRARLLLPLRTASTRPTSGR